ncbi:MAG: prepilin-type N-terminal cleavage/methylation domain-containing protein [Aeromonadaceae bacterium]
MSCRSRGFTLIEIMLVIVIIGCAVGVVVLSIPGVGGSGDRDLKSLSEQLTASVRMAAEQSVLEGRTIALQVDDAGYQFLVREAKSSPRDGKEGENPDDESQRESKGNTKEIPTAWEDQVWVPYEKEKFAASHEFPENTKVELELGGLALESDEARIGQQKPDWFGLGSDEEGKPNPEPQIFLLPGGEITPFKLTITEVLPGDDAGGESHFYRQIRGDETGQVRLLTADQVKAEDNQ